MKPPVRLDARVRPAYLCAMLPSQRAGIGRKLTAIALLLLAWGSLPQAAHASDPGPEPARRRFLAELGRDFGRFGTSHDTAAILAIGAGLGLVAGSFDAEITQSRLNAELHEDSIVDRVFEPGKLAGGAAAMLGGSLATLAVGKLAHQDSVADLGSELLRAQVLNGVLTHAVKKTAQRTRPDGSSRLSFPSGHTSGSFAAATVLQRRFGWRAGVPAFAFASYVGVSRLSENKHYLSDVVAGAALGIASGLSIGIRHERALIVAGPQPVPRGVGFGVVVAFP